MLALAINVLANQKHGRIPVSKSTVMASLGDLLFFGLETLGDVKI